MLPFIYGSFENQFYFLHRAFAFPTSTVAAVTVAVNMVACNFFLCSHSSIDIQIECVGCCCGIGECIADQCQGVGVSK